jgi:hypothetical protein
MTRLLDLPKVLRDAGCTVVEYSGWKERGSDTFDPIGVTWHATAGSRKSTPAGEAKTIAVTGSETAPAPISQLMITREGVVYVLASGRCNHNKVGWAGPNEGLGNRQLLGIECMNDNAGEPWPAAQLEALRLATAAMFVAYRWAPKRLAAHYEHQPYAGRPAGETSTKSDPFGVVMTDERPRVAKMISTLKSGGTLMDASDVWNHDIVATPNLAEIVGGKAGDPIDADTLLMLAVIHAGRVAKQSTANASSLTQLHAKVDQLTALVIELRDAHRPPADPTDPAAR